MRHDHDRDAVADHLAQQANAKLSAWPWPNLLTLLNVSGHARTASAGGTGIPVPGIRYSDRTGSPVSRSSSAGSTNLVPVGVEKTTTRHPAA